MRDGGDSDLVRSRRGEAWGETLDRRRGAEESRLRTLDAMLLQWQEWRAPPMSKNGGRAQTSDQDYLISI